MAEILFTNQANVAALYDNECDIEFTSNEVSTRIVTGLSAVKTADRTCWVNGPLNYTVVITNNSGVPVSNGILSDYMDPFLVALDTTFGIYINGVMTSNYSYMSGLLSVVLPLIQDGETVTANFRISQV